MCGRSYWSCYVSSTSLNIIGELNHIIVTLRHMFTPVGWLTWENVGGGCYNLVREWFNSWNGWEECVCLACMKVVYVVVMYAWRWSLLPLCCHV